MDTKTAGLFGAAAVMATVGAAHAATPSPRHEVLKAETYADLLSPIPNAVALLRSDNEALAERAAIDGQAKVEMAQYYYHHHHHHHRFFRPFYHHHHHHHFRRYHHHHHHHHHNFY